MTTQLIEMSVTDSYENKKILSAISFYGGTKRGMMLGMTLSFKDASHHTSVELDREQAIKLAKAILEKFEDVK